MGFKGAEATKTKAYFFIVISIYTSYDHAVKIF